MKRSVILILLLAVLAGCAVRISRSMATWKGANFNNLIASWDHSTRS
jgi:hypothetical protein